MKMPPVATVGPVPAALTGGADAHLEAGAAAPATLSVWRNTSHLTDVRTIESVREQS